MQCFTLPSLYPKTGLAYDYRAPSEHHYHRRPHYVPEPDKNGRMWNPDAFKPPLPFKQPWMIYEPVNHQHRERKMAEMLEHINKVNWTTGRDSKVHPVKHIPQIRADLNFRHSPKMATVTHTTYVDHGPQPVDRKWQTNVPVVGIRPCTYPYPYTKERCITANRVVGCIPNFANQTPSTLPDIGMRMDVAGQLRLLVDPRDAL